MLIRYDWRVGTSICDSDWRHSRRMTAEVAAGANGIAARRMFEGMCVNTIVLTNPILRAILAASRNEMAVTIWAAEKRRPSDDRFRLYRSKK